MQTGYVYGDCAIGNESVCRIYNQLFGQHIADTVYIAFDKLDFQGAEKSAGNKQGNILA